jgi:hypothetical protein
MLQLQPKYNTIYYKNNSKLTLFTADMISLWAEFVFVEYGATLSGIRYDWHKTSINILCPVDFKGSFS